MSRTRKDSYRRWAKQAPKRNYCLPWHWWLRYFFSVPAAFRRMENSKRRAKAKQAMRQGEDPLREYHTVAWLYW